MVWRILLILIYIKPLAEYKLKNAINNNQPAFLSAIDGELVAQIGDKIYKIR